MFDAAFNYHVNSHKGLQFTENFHFATDDLAVAITKVKAVGPLLAKMHGAQTELQDCRLSHTQFVRRGRLVRFQAEGVVASPSTEDSDYPTTALQLECYTDENDRVMLWLKGIPDGCIEKARKALTPAFIAAFQAFKTFATTPANLMCLSVRDRNGDKWRIDGLSETGIVTLPANNLVDDELVDIVGRGVPKYFRRKWAVIRQDDTHIKLFGAQTQPVFDFSGATGTLRRTGNVGHLITDMTVVFASEHDVHKEKK